MYLKQLMFLTYFVPIHFNFQCTVALPTACLAAVKQIIKEICFSKVELKSSTPVTFKYTFVVKTQQNHDDHELKSSDPVFN